MTQDTNNQEWWRESWAQFCLAHGYPLGNSQVEEFIAKASQQSREDALKECIEEMEEEMRLTFEKEQREAPPDQIVFDTYVVTLGEWVKKFKSKLPPKQ